MADQVHEHEILVAVVVRTPVQIEEAGLWLRDRLLAAGFPERIENEDLTHVDSFWIAEDFKTTSIDPGLEGMRSAVFVPEPLTQVEASRQLGFSAAMKGLVTRD